MTTSLSILWPKSTAPDIEEVTFSYDFCRRVSQELCQNIAQKYSWIDYPADWNLAHALSEAQSEMLFVVNKPELVLSSIVLNRLTKGLESGCIACGPVYNETSFSSQKAKLPFPYVNIPTFLEASQALESKKRRVITVHALDPACILYQRDFLKRVDAKHLLTEAYKSIPGTIKKSVAVDSGALVHIFRNYYEDEPDDRVGFVPQMVRCAIDMGWHFLQKLGAKHLLSESYVSNFERALRKKTLAVLHFSGSQNNWQRDCMIHLIPETVKNVLDIGCASGGYGKRLKQIRPEIFLKGIERNLIMAEYARNYYDDVVVSSVESANLPAGFDLVNCGDVLEHLHNPWEMLKRVHRLLRQGGHLVISIPNVGHWSIARDLLDGRYQYVPIGLLCVSHIRWFTESSIRQALMDADFEIEILYRQKIPPSPQGKVFIHHMCEKGYGDKESLLTNEFIIRAIKQ